MSKSKEMLEEYEKKPEIHQQHPLNKPEFQPQIPFTPQPRFQQQHQQPSYLNPYQATPQASGLAWGQPQLQPAMSTQNTSYAVNGFTQWSEGKVANLQSRLQKRLGPEYISQRAGGGGSKVSYIEGWKVLNLANEVFGFNGWSSSIVRLQTDFMDIKKDAKNGTGKETYTCNVTAIVRVTLKDGAYHEDVGSGQSQNIPSKGQALDKAQKEAVTDAIKRCLRNFGSVLGNCLYDNNFTSQISKIKVPVAKYNVDDCERRAEFTAAGSSGPGPIAAGTSKPSAIPSHMHPSTTANNNYRPSPLAESSTRPPNDSSFHQERSPDTPLRTLSDADAEEVYIPPEDSFDAEFGFGDEELFGVVEQAGQRQPGTTTSTSAYIDPEKPTYNHRQRPDLPTARPSLNGQNLTTAQSSTITFQQTRTNLQSNTSTSASTTTTSFGQRGPMQKSVSNGENFGGQARVPMQRSISGETTLQSKSLSGNDALSGGLKGASISVNGSKPLTTLNAVPNNNGASARALAIAAVLRSAAPEGSSTTTATKNSHAMSPTVSAPGPAADHGPGSGHSRSVFNRSESPKLPPGGVDQLAAKVNTNSRNFKEAAAKLDLSGETAVAGGDYGGFGSAARVKRSYENQDQERISVSPSKLSRGYESRRALGEIQLSPERNEKKPKWEVGGR